VAHEINNPLTYMSCNAQMLLEWFSEPGRISPDRLTETRDLLEEIAQGVDQVAGIVKDLASVAREPQSEKGPTDLGAILKTSLKIASSHIGSSARVRCDLPALPAVAASAPRLGQVFLNLLVNAAQAIPEGHADSNVIRIAVTTEEGGGAGDGWVTIAISDTGGGIPPAIRLRIFEPFFTTKPIGVGTGLGLAISHRIITQFGGTITYDTEVGKGTEFHIALPIAAHVSV